MFDWIRRLFTKKENAPEPLPMERSLNSRDHLTTGETEYILTALTKAVGPVCPDCEQGYFLAGPQGGESTNVRCDHCGSEFNLCLFGTLVIGERITNKGERDITRDWCYPTQGAYYGNHRPPDDEV